MFQVLKYIIFENATLLRTGSQTISKKLLEDCKYSQFGNSYRDTREKDDWKHNTANVRIIARPEITLT